MQRQSLGSPVSKLHSHGGAAVAVTREDVTAAEEAKRRDSFSVSSVLSEYDDEDRKAAKLHRLSTSSLLPPKPEKFVHLIPVLTVLCFLVLYLCSHSPSQTDLAQFNGFKRSPNRIDPAEAIDDIDGLSELQRRNVVAIRSLRNLQEVKKRSSKYQLSRKLGDF
ncbi:uncharacterized protein LOC116202237 isoform X2 [Punica granatum]|uniref:Uncharacterized protein LOC116202237 isoform X2 n=1 Tax=Punica granatum TaxID=22663 RepID=A0A6P8D503_PUNGR|nr:uncharacterized protein LOC116202237 isoform X2 [Punica granatum]